MVDWEVERARTGFWAVGLALGLVVAYVVFRFVGTFVFGLFIYYATRPVYRRLRPRVDHASVAAAGALFLLALPALLLVAYAVAIGVQEVNRFAKTVELGPFEDVVQPYLDVTAIVQDPQQLLSDGGFAVVTDFLEQASSFLGFFGLLALHAFLMFAIAFYLLRDDRRLSRWFRTRFSDDRGVVDAYLRAVDRDLHNVFFGNILNAVLTGTIGTIAYSLLDLAAPAGLSVPYAAMLGLLAGVASLVPVVGMKLVYVPVGLWLLGQPLLQGLTGVMWFPVLFVLVSLVVVDTIPDLILRPYVSGRSLHVGMVMTAYILGPLLFGWYGIFLAPVLLVLAVHFGRVVLPELVSGQPIRPYAVDPGNLTYEATTGADASATADVDPKAARDGGGDGTESVSPADDETDEHGGGAPTSEAGPAETDGADGGPAAPDGEGS